MGGTISVESAENQGSRFCISLPNVPIARVDKEADSKGAFNPDDIIFDTSTVLIADDVANNRLLIKEFLRPAPITLLEAENGEDAVQMALEHKPDVALLDLRMPVLGGVEAMNKICADDETRTVPMIALTASSMKGEKEKMLGLGFSGYLTKPIEKATLYQELTKFIPHTNIAGHSPGDESGAEESINPNLLSKIIQQLENRFQRQWTTARNNQEFEEIANFAQQIMQLGEKNEISILKTYGEDLNTHVGSFDVEKMNSTLNDYPNMVESIKTLKAQKEAPDMVEKATARRG